MSGKKTAVDRHTDRRRKDPTFVADYSEAIRLLTSWLEAEAEGDKEDWAEVARFLLDDKNGGFG